MAIDKKRVSLVSQEEEDSISRSLLAWLNRYPNKPAGMIDYEYLRAGVPGMALSTVQGAYVLRRYIYGGHVAEYQFKLIYRLKLTGDLNLDPRLKADEELNKIGTWLVNNPPDLGREIRHINTEVTARASLFGMYENGDEDHQILMKLTYEVM